MKPLLSLLLFILSFTCTAQVANPAMRWLKGYGGGGVDKILQPVSVTKDDGFIICLETNSKSGTGNIDSFCSASIKSFNYIKFDANASKVEWSKCTDNGPYLFQINDTSFDIGGTASGDSWAFKFVKEDFYGNVKLYKKYGDTASSILRSMIKLKDGNYIMAGTCNYTDADATVHYGSWMYNDILVIKIDTSGNKIWSKVIGGSDDETVMAITEGPNRSIYIAGNTKSNDYDCTGNHGLRDAYIVRLDNAGNILWHRDLGGSDEDADGYNYNGWAMPDGKGGILFVNASSSNDGDIHHAFGSDDFWLVDLDSSGNIAWENSYGSTYTEVPYAICRATDNSIWITGLSGYGSRRNGEIDTAFAKSDAWIVHVDSNGKFLSGKVLGSYDDDWGQMIYSLSNGGVIMGGAYNAKNGNFSSLPFYGTIDAYLAVFEPWTTNVIKPEEFRAFHVSISPNPAKDNFQIKLDNTIHGYGSILIANVLGSTLYESHIPILFPLQVDASNFPNGLYIVQLTNITGYTETQKIIIQH